MPTWRRALVCDLLGLAVLLLCLLDYFRPSLLLLPTIAAGGDTPCHFPTAVFFHEHFLPHLRHHGWFPGAYMGHPLLLYYFPLPFLFMSGVAPLVGLPAAFKLGTALGVFLLPVLVYVGFRWMGFRFPGPLLGAAASVVFLFLEDNPIWGGTMASTLTGEFAYTLGIGLAVLFLGGIFRAFDSGRSPLVPAALLGLTALAHGYAVLWAGLSASYFLYRAFRPWRALAWLLTVAGLAFALAGFFLVPLLADWGWTTSYDDPWIEVTTVTLFPAFLWPLMACAALGLVVTLARGYWKGRWDQRLLFLAHAALVATALAAAGPAMGIIDVRFVPFAHLAVCLLAGAALGTALEKLEAPELAALGLVLVAVVYGDSRSKVLRYWIDWNYTGLEAKELWPAWKELNEVLAGSVSDPRVAVEYSTEHEKAGSIRMYETLPLLSGRSTLEGVYNQASLQTHAVYYLTSELCERSPNPFRRLEYSQFDTERALQHLRLFNVREIVALSPKLVESLEAREDVALVASIPPYTVFRLKDPGPGYVEPLGYEPVRSSLHGWRDKAYRWFARDPPSPAHLVFTDDESFGTVELDEWLPPPAVPLEPGVEVVAKLERESLVIHTTRPGHPLLVKVSYHPRWRAEGADGPYLISPALMMVVPREETVRLSYSRTWGDRLGLLLSIAALVLVVLPASRRRFEAWWGEAAPAHREGVPEPTPRRRWGGVVPSGLVVLLLAARFIPTPGQSDAALADELGDRASKAYAAERFEAAAEYALQAISKADTPEERAGLSCLRGESLLRAGRFAEAGKSFEAATQLVPTGVYVAQALSGLARAREAAGDVEAAALARERLRSEFPHTPWAESLE